MRTTLTASLIQIGLTQTGLIQIGIRAPKPGICPGKTGTRRAFQSTSRSLFETLARQVATLARQVATLARQARQVTVLTALIAASTSTLASPQDIPPTLEEVIVRAELRATPWLEQAASSSIIGDARIQSRAAIHLENLLQLAPNVNIAGGSSRARFYQVRGVGERSQFVEPLNPSVGLLIDGIDFSGLGGAATLFDIDQVEILRGPQGTLHGANALAGLINIRSAAPSATPEARIQSTFGDYGRRELGASISGPLIEDKLLLRLAAFQHESDGFIRNTFLGRSDTNNRDERLLRGKLRWLIDARQTLDVTAFQVNADNGYDAFSLDNTRNTLSDMPGRDRQDSDALGIHYEFSSERIVTEVMASAAQTQSEYSYDEDWSFVGIAPELEYSSFDQFRRQRDSYSAQLRLSSAEATQLPVGALDWVVGLYGLNDDESLRRNYTFLENEFRSRFEARTVAAYGQVDIDFGNAWSASAGLRLARRAMAYGDSNNVDSEPDDTLWGGKLALEYALNDTGIMYASISRGYRASGVNAGILAAPDDSIGDAGQSASLQFFDAELLYNLEIGHKATFAQDRVQSALALFYMDRRDQQVRGSLVLPRGDGSTAFIDFTDNAASGYNLGLEWELRVQASSKVEFYTNVGLLRARFDEYINADGDDLDGREQAHAPSYQFAAGLTYRPTSAWQADVQWEGRDAFFFSDRHDEQSTRYSLLHTRVAYTQKNWSLAAFARNLLDEDFFIRGFGSFGNDPRKGYVTEEYVQFGEPRQIGISIELSL